MTETLPQNDWLLKAGRFGSLTARYFLLGVAILCGLIAVLAVIASAVQVFVPDVFDRIEDESLNLAETLGIAALLALLTYVLWLGSRFFLLLAQIIETVGQGDPFIEENANRLRSMGLINLIVFAISAFAVAGIVAFTGIFDTTAEDLTLEVSFESLFLAVLLFILSRVFRHGAIMREDLEGTV